MQSKTLLFAIAPVVAGVAFSFFLWQLAVTGSNVYLIATLAAGFIFLALLLVQTLISSFFRDTIIIIAVETLALGTFFYIHTNYWIIVGLIVVFGALVTAYYAGRKELENTITIRFFQIRRTVLAKSIIGLVIFGVLAHISFINLDTLVVSKEFFISIGRPVEYAVKKLILEDFSLQMTMEEFFRALAKNSFPEEITSLPPEKQKPFFEKAISDLSATIQKFTSVEVNLEGSVEDAIFEVSNAQWKRIPQAKRPIAFIVWGVILFMIVTGFSFLFSWLIGLISWLFYQLLLAAGFIKIGYQDRRGEVIIV